MSYYTFFLLALGLSMDTFAVSITSGIAIKQTCLRYACKFSVFFAVFHSLMLFIGWLAGLTVKDYLHSFSHWIAFGLLTFIGGKMIYESTILKCDDKCDQYGILVLSALAFATSIDALTIGVSFSLLGYRILVPVLMLAGVTFIVALTGIYLGGKLGSYFAKRMELLGGAILILIGISILIK